MKYEGRPESADKHSSFVLYDYIKALVKIPFRPDPAVKTKGETEGIPAAPRFPAGFTG